MALCSDTQCIARVQRYSLLVEKTPGVIGNAETGSPSRGTLASPREDPTSLCLSLFLVSQGIHGTDNRYYALDLFRIFPPDPNYTQLEEGEGGEEGSEKEKEGDERRKTQDEKGGYRHKLAVLRPELLETFLQ